MEVLRSLAHPNEVYALINYKLRGWTKRAHLSERSPKLKRCYEFLNMTSRSFSAVIQALDDELRDAVCIFYLVLRALDTVEDDMTIPYDEKVILLRNFHTFLEDPSWTYAKSKEKDRVVLEDFTAISCQYRQLNQTFREVIAGICRRMGEGMIVFLNKSPNSMQEWDEYCHYVAGLVGIGLSQLFASSNLEDPVVAKDTALSNSMGLFLQKTNIIRDYLEDVLQGRHFWPKEVWSKYCRNLIELSQPEKTNEALSCLNELITNALSHVPDVMTYLARIRNQSVFNFCAIPQVMAIATLERCYNNQQVFRGVVKIRKGEAVHLMMQATNIDNVEAIFSRFLKKIENNIPSSEPSARLTHDVVRVALDRCRSTTSNITTMWSLGDFQPIYYLSIIFIIAIVFNYFWTTVFGSSMM